MCSRSVLSICKTLTCCSSAACWWPSPSSTGTFTSASLSKF
ncbi:hypothetical protein EYF80_066308 [Liparis tanakae]|uniref:Uncharacterized protein n=1 Tax=Liparis tanakae TaxID=230148 RepID=A0A4Z2E4S2_9TELE|nr:hypothetical protein EYF80_066308 [Liparis tanakae]